MSLTIQIILLVALLILFVLSSIYSGSETAYTSVSKAHVREMVQNKESGAKLIYKQLERYNQLLSAILIGNNIVNVASATLTSALLGSILSQNEVLIVIISTAVVTPILVIFGEIAPKLLAKNNPIRFLKIFCYFIEGTFWLFYVLTYPISKLGKKVYVTHSEDQLKSILDLAQSEGVLQTGESILAQKALDLDSTKVSQHYIRLKDVVYLDYKDNISKALEVFKETNYSRLPVMKNGQLIGIVLIKDIFHLQKGKVINYLKTVPLISANSILSSALEKMRLARAQMAFVTQSNNKVDTIGIITMEDIIEEIIGEIYDEYDDEEEIYEISLQKSRVVVSAYIYDVFKQLEIDLELLSEDEEEMTVRQYLLKKTNSKRIYKNTRFNLNDIVSFKVVETFQGKPNDTIVEINKI
ncbi:hemolysin C [Mycoplasmopsis gallinacea]|uniref:Hemolysin C n=1 Tax=Mycoplasmopsis gallinacea TaxID=29556 RepID=A0A0D5ZJ08_9BACT|nr:hemolysin C [Mycoplasmopsis gallinacea]